ncbi:2-C-methyl-D-erythritol 4-phosphate cytidylyltransferase, partial [Salmonella enterica subsp. enterica serovar Oslo]|nr:2-C-methyl-D-erythritol 4-phosphate cytidylyltransferase [Salmonella enterica subsp. enterica serovar Oslo]
RRRQRQMCIRDSIKVTRPEDLALAEFYLTRSRHQEKA